MAEDFNGSLAEHPHGAMIYEDLVRNPLGLDKFERGHFGRLPLRDLSQQEAWEFHERIVNDIFSNVDIDRDDAFDCWNECAYRIHVQGFYLAEVFTTYAGYDDIKEECARALALPRSSGQIPCLSAPILVSLIALLNYGRVSPSKPDDCVLEMLDRQMEKFLYAAIQVWPRSKQEPFLIHAATFSGRAEAEVEFRDGVWVVDATVPAPNIYSPLLLRQLPVLRVAPEFSLDMVQPPESQKGALDRLTLKHFGDNESLLDSLPESKYVTQALVASQDGNVIHPEHEYQPNISSDMIQYLKDLYAKFRQDNIAVPQALHNLAGSICTSNQLREVLHRE